MQKNKSFLIFIGCVVVVIIILVLLTKKSDSKIIKNYATALNQKDAHKLAQLMDINEVFYGLYSSTEDVEEFWASCLKDLNSYKLIKQTRIKSKEDMEKALEEEISDEEWKIYETVYFENEDAVYYLDVEINGKEDNDIVCLNENNKIVWSSYLQEHNPKGVLEQTKQSRNRIAQLDQANEAIRIAVSEIQTQYTSAYAITKNIQFENFFIYSNFDSQLQKQGYKLCTETDMNTQPSNMSAVAEGTCYFTDGTSIYKVALTISQSYSVKIGNLEIVE